MKIQIFFLNYNNLVWGQSSFKETFDAAQVKQGGNFNSLYQENHCQECMKFEQKGKTAYVAVEMRNYKTDILEYVKGIE
uniref:Uncharacterized protein n=1 Tax=Arion vulgaris TaxID=1028688 RepID=A0A0B6ZCL8_9EUPU